MSMQTTGRPLKIEHKGARTPYKPKPWSHQRDLADLKGKPVRVTFLSESHSLVGHVIDADPYTIKLQQPNRPAHILFKHALEQITPLTAAEIKVWAPEVEKVA